MDPVTLYHRDGTPVVVRSATERTNLLASGYRTEKPFDPSEHTAPEVPDHIEAHTEEAPVVVAKERQGKNRTTALPVSADQPAGDAGGNG